jgi:hypothetical protein
MPEVDVGKLEALAGSKYICGETWIKKKKTIMLVRNCRRRRPPARFSPDRTIS